MDEDINTKRSYDNSLRLQQQELTRDTIMYAVESLILEGRLHNFTIQEVADKAGVSYATVYRHFSSRHAIIEGLIHWGLEHTLKIIPPYPKRLEDLPSWVEQTVPVLMPYLRPMKAVEAARSAIDLKEIPPSSRARDELFLELVKEATPNLSEAYQKAAAADLRVWASMRTMAELHVRYGLDEETLVLAVSEGMRAQVESIKKHVDEARKGEKFHDS